MIIRDYKPTDECELNNVARLAFAEFCDQFEDWPIVHEAFGRMADLAEEGQIVVVDDKNGIVGGVCYLGPDSDKFKCFEPGWAVIRSLVVHPNHRGKGIGMSVVKRIVDDYTGKIEIHSHVNKGTEIVIALPSNEQKSRPQLIVGDD